MSQNFGARFREAAHFNPVRIVAQLDCGHCWG
jgi:hypothetical protein